ncbi:MAG: hypothetical protein POELPBGB_01881 [Bacteroidia bacterium]|nr:hypothetical protein [Bacteroidia bacterium]
MEQTPLLIYGAYGYTGELITQNAVKKGWKPLLAGRNEEKLKVLAGKYGLEYAVFDVNEKEKLVAALTGKKAVLHCAGPFAHTFKQMINACLQTGTHYLDITGEIVVFEGAAAKNEVAKKAGIMLMPGTGFDVVPSDCLAAYLKKQLPDATSLKLAFTTLGRMSRGTSLTMVENLGAGGAVRKDGKITKVKNAHKVQEFPFGEKKILCATIPWGDVSTAYYSTGIPNIETYMSASPSMVKSMKTGNYIGWLLSTSLVQNYLKAQVNKRKPGPDETERKNGYSMFYGEVQNAKGEKKSAGLKTLEGYSLTAATAVNIAEKVLNGNFKTGYMTPSLAYGADLILETEGTKRYDV